jgi:hypothetical protein
MWDITCDDLPFFKKESFVYVQGEKRKMVSREGKWGRLKLLSGFGTRVLFGAMVQLLFLLNFEFFLFQFFFVFGDYFGVLLSRNKIYKIKKLF